MLASPHKAVPTAANGHGHNGHGHDHTDTGSPDGVGECLHGENHTGPDHTHSHTKMPAVQYTQIHEVQCTGHEHSKATRFDRNLAVWGNAVVGVASMVATGLSSMSVFNDGLHSTAEVGAYGLQFKSLHEEDPERRMRNKRIVYSVLFASGVLGTIKPLKDLVDGVDHTATGVELTAASASLALNATLGVRLAINNGVRGIRDFKKLSGELKDIARHFILFDMPSSLIAVGGAAIQNSSSRAEQFAGAVSGAIAAYAFLPTKKKLAHGSCLDPNHVHDHGHAHDHNHEHTDITDHLDNLDHEHDHEQEANVHGSTHAYIDHGHHAGHDHHEHPVEDGQHDRALLETSGIFKRVHSKVSNAVLRPIVSAQTATMSALEKVKQHRRISAASAVALAGIGLYAYQRFGRDILPMPKNHVALQESTQGQLNDAFPTVPTGFRGFESLQSAQETAQQVASTVPLPKYNSTTHDGTLWRIAERLLQSKSPTKPTNSAIAELTQALLDDNGQTQASATQLPAGFNVVVNGSSVTNLLAVSG